MYNFYAEVSRLSSLDKVFQRPIPSRWRCPAQTLYKHPEVYPGGGGGNCCITSEKGTSVADSTHALWGLCTGFGLFASPLPKKSTLPLSLPYYPPPTPLWVDREQLCLPLCTSLKEPFIAAGRGTSAHLQLYPQLHLHCLLPPSWQHTFNTHIL